MKINTLEKVIVIVGCGGLGTHLAASLLAANTSLVITSTNDETLQNAKDAIIGDALHKENLHTIVCDVTQKSDCHSLAGFIDDLGGGCDLLINCVGSHYSVGPFADSDFEDWQADINVNFVGVARAVHSLLPHLQQRGGLILNFAGGGGAGSRPNFSSYASAKTALVRLTETIADENAENGVRANIIAPGMMPTKLLKCAAHQGVSEVEKAKANDVLTALPPDNFVAVEKLVNFLFSGVGKNLSGFYLSAQWDNYDVLADEFQSSGGSAISDVFKLRRIVGGMIDRKDLDK
ncbi:SDR family oxidoreductase [Alphaproteobacteria bacterium]|nr:SDR family oxidoreductase [Alphaproteobacteria bacterium]